MNDITPTGGSKKPETGAADSKRRRPYRKPEVKTSEAFESVSAGCCKGPVAAPSS